MLAGELMREVLSAIAELPATQRAAVLAELAGDVSSTRRETHRKRSQRARHTLRERLAGPPSDPVASRVRVSARRCCPGCSAPVGVVQCERDHSSRHPLHLTPAAVGTGGSPGALAGIIGVAGCFVVLGWVLWRFGATLARGSGLASFVLAWLIGMEGGYGYAAFFLVLGVVLWGGGTIAFASRRGYWPSSLTARRVRARPR